MNQQITNTYISAASGLEFALWAASMVALILYAIL